MTLRIHDVIIIARLLLPFSPKASIVGSAFEQTSRYVEQVTIQSQEGKLPIVIVLALEQEEKKTATGNMESSFQWQSVIMLATENLWIIWLLVAMIMLVRKITVYQSFVKYVRAGSRRIEDIELLEQLVRIVKRENVKVATHEFVVIKFTFECFFFEGGMVKLVIEKPPNQNWMDNIWR